MRLEILRTKTFILFEKILAVLIMPVVGIAIPFFFGLFSGLPFSKALTAYLFCILITFAVWLGCRNFFILLRFSQRLHLPYTQFIAWYSAVAFLYSFFLSYLSFKLLLKDYLNLDVNIVLFSCIAAFLACFVSAVYEIIMLYEQGKAEKLKNVRLRKSRTLSQLNSLKARVEPHFLFNSLSTLQNLINEDKELANRFNLTLSETYYQIIEVADKDFISVDTDISMMYKYYQLVSIRFPDAIKLRMSLEEFNLTNAIIPPLSLQLLLENALKHNSFSKDQPLELRISINKNSITVANKKTKRIVHPVQSKKGLRILSERFFLLLQKRIEILDTESSFSVILPLKTV